MGKIFKALEKSGRIDQEKCKEDHTVKIEDAPEPLNVSKTITVPQNPMLDIDPMLITGLDPHSMESEQFRLLKNSILFPEKGAPPKCIMITSASPSEGKSFVASNLAVSIAQNIDEHVLLMDCDLRSPSIHKLFGFEGMSGLSEYLSDTIPLNSLLVKSFLNKLTLLPAGSIPVNPSELLSSEQMRHLIHEVKLRYNDRYIIIDTPPPTLTSESNAIARQVDGIVIVVKQGRTQKKDVVDLIDIYGREKIIGVVYNFAQKKTFYGYRKYSYGKYGSAV